MAALLVALSIMSVMLAVVMPVWKQMAQREKETELIFRGQQYARAIGMFQRRAGPGTLPPNLDILVEQRFLRKKFKDPITGEDFQPLIAGQAVPASGAGGAAQGGRGGAAPGATSPGGTPSAFGAPRPAGQTAAGQTPGMPGATGAVGGIQGVVSKSKAKSIRIYNGRNFYNEWTFVFVAQVQAPAAGAPGPGRGRGTGPGGPGQPPTGPGGIGGIGGRGGRGGPQPTPRGGPGTSPTDPRGGSGNPSPVPTFPPGG